MLRHSRARLSLYDTLMTNVVSNARYVPIVKEPKPIATSVQSNFCVRLIPSLGGASRDRTGDPLLAKQVLSQLSYGPDKNWWVWEDSNLRPRPYQGRALTT